MYLNIFRSNLFFLNFSIETINKIQFIQKNLIKDQKIAETETDRFTIERF